MIAGRIAWTEDGEFTTPWLSFRTQPEFRTWTRDMRKAIAKRDGLNPRKLKAEFHYVNVVWTAESLLRYTQGSDTTE